MKLSERIVEEHAIHPNKSGLLISKELGCSQTYVSFVLRGMESRYTRYSKPKCGDREVLSTCPKCHKTHKTQGDKWAYCPDHEYIRGIDCDDAAIYVC
jgi:hypothetical protein